MPSPDPAVGELSGDDLLDALVAPVEPTFAGALVVATDPPSDPGDDRLPLALERLAVLPCVVVGGPAWTTTPRSGDVGLAGGGAPGAPADVARRGGALPSVGGGPPTGSEVGGSGVAGLVDLVVADDDELAAVVATVERAPVASASLALHLRVTARRSVADGLVVESALYSALQAGPEHAAWRAATPVRDRPADGDPGRPRVRVARVGDELHLVLDRPAVRNAIDAALRDELLAGLAVAEADPDLQVVVRGEGPAFCAGGDLDEFGTAPDPVTAHVVRLRASLAAVLARLADRTTVHVHGPCAGSGVELAAFAGRVVADAGATFVLPELSLGLIPGAGGTVSLPARIGRHRTAWLALTGRTIDAATALAWGLVDALEPP